MHVEQSRKGVSSFHTVHLTVCVSMVTGSEPSDPNYAAENTQPVTMTTAVAVTSLTPTDKDDVFSLCS